MAKISFNKYHNKYEVYYRNGNGKKHVGYYQHYSTADHVRVAVDAALVMK